MRRSPGRPPAIIGEGRGRSVSVWLRPSEEDLVDAAVLPTESRADMIRTAVLALARTRLRAKGKAAG